mgnify:CR=1 FL=1
MRAGAPESIWNSRRTRLARVRHVQPEFHGNYHPARWHPQLPVAGLEAALPYPTHGQLRRDASFMFSQGGLVPVGVPVVAWPSFSRPWQPAFTPASLTLPGAARLHPARPVGSGSSACTPRTVAAMSAHLPRTSAPPEQQPATRETPAAASPEQMEPATARGSTHCGTRETRRKDDGVSQLVPSNGASGSKSIVGQNSKHSSKLVKGARTSLRRVAKAEGSRELRDSEPAPDTPAQSKPRARFKGVSRTNKRWRAKIFALGRSISLGHFPTVKTAAIGYDIAARLLRGVRNATSVNFLDDELTQLAPLWLVECVVKAIRASLNNTGDSVASVDDNLAWLLERKRALEECSADRGVKRSRSWATESRRKEDRQRPRTHVGNTSGRQRVARFMHPTFSSASASLPYALHIRDLHPPVCVIPPQSTPPAAPLVARSMLTAPAMFHTPFPGR